MTIAAVIFVPAGHIATYASQCLDYCAIRGYDVAGLVTGNLATAAALLADHTAAVIVVARLGHITHIEGPRVEIVSEHVARPGRGNRRSHIIRRDAAE